VEDFWSGPILLKAPTLQTAANMPGQLSNLVSLLDIFGAILLVALAHPRPHDAPVKLDLRPNQPGQIRGKTGRIGKAGVIYGLLQRAHAA
jgi:hypothetical protein